MAELSVVAVITAQHGKADVVRDALSALVPPTRNEEGCIEYDLFESDLADTFVTIEKWRDPADLQAHMSSTHIKETFAVAGEALAGAPVIHQLRRVDV